MSEVISVFLLCERVTPRGTLHTSFFPKITQIIDPNYLSNPHIYISEAGGVASFTVRYEVEPEISGITSDNCPKIIEIIFIFIPDIEEMTTINGYMSANCLYVPLARPVQADNEQQKPVIEPLLIHLLAFAEVGFIRMQPLSDSSSAE